MSDTVQKAVVWAYVMPEDGQWFIRCRSLDYCACGPTPSQAKRNFVDGLAATLELHKPLMEKKRHQVGCLLCSLTRGEMPLINWDYISAADDSDPI